MLRTILIYLSKSKWARQFLTQWRFTWRAVSRFVAGERPQDAINAIRELNAKGIVATLDHLGENVTNAEEAYRSADDIIHILSLVNQEGVRSGVSIKLSQIGLALGEEICEPNLRRILSQAKEINSFVRIDMEDSPYTEATLKLFHQMQCSGFADDVGIVIQAYLYRSEEDVRKLVDAGAKVRLCKGAYKESSKIAFPKKSEVDENFDLLTSILIDGAMERGSPEISKDGITPPIPAIATHDEDRIAFAKLYAEQVRLTNEALEFQMLYGIRRRLQRQLAEEGYPVRVYVPYGTEWYPYFMRRLAERPANLWFLLSNLFKR
ncbi:MAG: proline dehydrogenase family protein [Anaerolineales bacterium]|jgi:proline dehydrogenase